MVRVEAGPLDLQPDALPMELLGNIPSMEYLIYIKKGSTLYGLQLEFHRISQQAYANMICFI